MSPSQLIGGRFRIDDLEHDLLGRGGMGAVYCATDTLTDELVAVKVLDSTSEVSKTSEVFQRFAREGEALRRLNHPNIVRMVAAIEEQGQYYLVMEHVAGGSLRDVLDKEGHLPVIRAVEIALDLADALTRAHRLGILHRDLKPENVLLAADGTPRLADFGLARLAAGPRLTQSGMLMGTVDYVSPEACQGEAPDERLDIWSFGVMLFEMLAGRVPFTGDTFVARLNAILTQPVPDLSQLAPGVPDGLADLVYRMLDKDRQQRVPSVRLVGAELEALLKGRTPSHAAPAGSRFATPRPPAGGPKHNLPLQTTPFVGREAELRELARLLEDRAVRLVSVVALGGMGKTRLAVEAGARQLERFAHGVWFVSLAGLQAVEAMVPATAQALGFTFYEGREPRRQLLDYLREKRLLLIYDNFEHLLACPEPGRGGGVSLVNDILHSAKDVLVLTTSRVRLGLPEEHLFHLAGMDFPDWETPTDAADRDGRTEYSAVKLFLQSARRARPGFELAAEDLNDVARICRLVTGMPLGILLAAAWLEMLTPAEIAAEMQRSLDFLATDLPGADERQRSVRAVLDYSWSSLTEQERAVFRGLSVFRGGFSREAAQAVTGAGLRELMGLVNKSLLQRDPGGRYQIHELLRQYAAERLEQLPAEEAAIRDHHCTYYLEFLRQRETQLIGLGQKQALAEIAVEIENVWAGWNWAVAQGRIADINRCLDSLAEVHWIRSWYQEAQDAFARAAERLAEHQLGVDSQTVRFTQAKLLREQGRFCGRLGSTEAGCEQLRQSVEVFRDLAARREAAWALCYLGDLVPQPDCIDLYQQGLDIFTEIGDRRGMAEILGDLGLVAVYQAEYDKAKELLRKALAISRELGDQQGIMDSLRLLSYANWVTGEYEDARQLAEDSLAEAREIGALSGIAGSLANLARAALGLADFDMGRRLYQDSLTLCRQIGWRRGIEIALGDLGELATTVGEYTEALQVAGEGLVLAKESLDPTRKAWQLRVLGDAACGLEDAAQARRYFHQALQMLTAVSVPSFALLTLVGIARLLSAKGDKERACELLALVVYHPLSWKWTKDRAAPLVAELETALPPDVVAAAQERGRARDLDATVAELLVELGE